jgi:hypothetical protein
MHYEAPAWAQRSRTCDVQREAPLATARKPRLITCAAPRA